MAVMAGVYGPTVPRSSYVPSFYYSFSREKEELPDLPLGQKSVPIEAVTYGRLSLADLPAPATPDIARPRRTLDLGGVDTISA
jgi:hypothetical protein